LSADNQCVALDLNDNGSVDITLNLAGNWTTGDTLKFFTFQTRQHNNDRRLL